MDAQRIIVEIISPSHRRFHVSTAFNCEIEHLMLSTKLQELFTTNHPESIEEAQALLAEFTSSNSPSCSLQDALETLEGCVHGHDGATGLVDVTINLAIADWSIVQKKVIKLLRENLSWNEPTIDLEVVQ